jgi:peptidoglycan/LPS O-acetylase OafA/YrhL
MRITLTPDVISVSFFPFILLCGAYGSASIDKLFAKKWLQRIGDWSFSIYLTHQPLIFTIGSVIAYLNPPDPNFKPSGPPPHPEFFTAWLGCLVFIALTLFVSSLTYLYLEVPARLRINKPATKVRI